MGLHCFTVRIISLAYRTANSWTSCMKRRRTLRDSILTMISRTIHIYTRSWTPPSSLRKRNSTQASLVIIHKVGWMWVSRRLRFRTSLLAVLNCRGPDRKKEGTRRSFSRVHHSFWQLLRMWSRKNLSSKAPRRNETPRSPTSQLSWCNQAAKKRAAIGRNPRNLRPRLCLRRLSLSSRSLNIAIWHLPR